jgi:hypothetical protein
MLCLCRVGRGNFVFIIFAKSFAFYKKHTKGYRHAIFGKNAKNGPSINQETIPYLQVSRKGFFVHLLYYLFFNFYQPFEDRAGEPDKSAEAEQWDRKTVTGKL